MKKSCSKIPNVFYFLIYFFFLDLFFYFHFSFFGGYYMNYKKLTNRHKVITNKRMSLNELTNKHKIILNEVRKKLENMELEEVCKLMEEFDEINDKYIKEKENGRKTNK